MTGQILVDQQQATAPPGAAATAAGRAGAGEHGTLMLDRTGRILSCGAPVEKIFGASHGRLMGRQISEFIAGLLLGGTSPSYRARYLVYLCAIGEWRPFEAMDADGGRIAVEAKVSQMMTNGQEIFLLAVRRADAT